MGKGVQTEDISEQGDRAQREKREKTQAFWLKSNKVRPGIRTPEGCRQRSGVQTQVGMGA